MQLRVPGMLASEPTGNMPRRPVMLQFTRYDQLQRSVLGEQTGLRATCQLPSGPVGLSSPIASPPSVPRHFLADRGNSSIKAPADSSESLTRCNAARNLFALTDAEHPWRPSTLPWRNTASGLQDARQLARSLAPCTPDLKARPAHPPPRHPHAP